MFLGPSAKANYISEFCSKNVYVTIFSAPACDLNISFCHSDIYNTKENTPVIFIYMRSNCAKISIWLVLTELLYRGGGGGANTATPKQYICITIFETVTVKPN